MKRSTFKGIFFLFTFLAIALISVKFFGTFGKYSEGTRTGQLTKFSEKGWILSTYEGEIVMGGLSTNMDGAATANIFQFSTTEQEVIDTLKANAGANVTLTYTEFFNVNIAEGNTNYLVTSVKVNR